MTGMVVPETGIYASINEDYIINLVEGDKVLFDTDNKFQILKLVKSK